MRIISWMKYVKLTAKPNTWFKDGTEVYHYDFDYSEKRRLTLEELSEWYNDPAMVKGILVRGIRVCKEGYEQNDPLNYKIGEEREDGEFCSFDEFNVEIIE